MISDHQEQRPNPRGRMCGKLFVFHSGGGHMWRFFLAVMCPVQDSTPKAYSCVVDGVSRCPVVLDWEGRGMIPQGTMRLRDRVRVWIILGVTLRVRVWVRSRARVRINVRLKVWRS